jgi:hypothetical protein
MWRLAFFEGNGRRSKARGPADQRLQDMQGTVSCRTDWDEWAAMIAVEVRYGGD